MNRLTQQLGLGALVLAAFATSVSATELAVPCSDASVQRAADSQQNWRYPFEARKQRAEGTVRLQVQLATDGSATQVKLAASSGSSILDRAALKAARNARFCKLKSPDETMSGLAEVSVHYALNVAVAKL